MDRFFGLRVMSQESYAGLLLLLATGAALLMSNTSLYGFYESLFYTPMMPQAGKLLLSQPIVVWINDGLMTIFFFLVGLELKKERKLGELRKIHQILMPGVAALGGVLCPMFIYVMLNYHHPFYIHGWGIPMATDIAFSVGVLSCFSDRVPPRMRVFLLTLAVLDDLAAIIVIAIFYTVQLNIIAMMIASLSCLGLWYLNHKRIDFLFPYLFIGIILWISVLYSGVHATISGVLLAFFMPLKSRSGRPILEVLIEQLKPWVSYLILPLFALANAGVHLGNVGFSNLDHSVVLGVFLGLVIGKPVGVILFSRLYVELMRYKTNLGHIEMMTIGVLAGIGFTMSLFIATLSFEMSQVAMLDCARLGILGASGFSMILGGLMLWKCFPVIHKI